MHCNDTASSTICANCDGVVMDHPYYRAYVRSDDKKHCQRKLTDKMGVNITNWCDDLLSKALILHVNPWLQQNR